MKTQCAQLLSKCNSENGYRKIQKRKLLVCTIIPNNPLNPILHNSDLHLALPDSLLLFSDKRRFRLNVSLS